MIASIKGTVIDKETDALVLSVGSVGILISVPHALRERVNHGESLFLHTYLVVREDALALYGFETKQERDFFVLFLGVNGVGPRLALAALSALNPEAIRRAVFHEQSDVFSRIPGVGKKTAQKILLHLQGRISDADEFSTAARMTDLDTEIFEALTVLGYSVVEAQAAIQSIPQDALDDVEERLRLALQYFR